jgi:hypothetical protein
MNKKAAAPIVHYLNMQRCTAFAHGAICRHQCARSIFFHLPERTLFPTSYLPVLLLHYRMCMTTPFCCAAGRFHPDQELALCQLVKCTGALIHIILQ